MNNVQGIKVKVFKKIYPNNWKSIFAFTFILFFQESFACRCRDYPSLEEAVRNTHVIFLAKVIHKDTTNEIVTLFPKVPLLKYTLFLQKKWKGNFASDTVSFYTPRSSASCGFKFQIGKQYIIYANKDNNIFFTHQCTRTNEFSPDEYADLEKYLK